MKKNRPRRDLSESHLNRARQAFRKSEPRDLFYRAARELIRLSMEGRTELSVAEAIGALLQTWNKSFYRFHGGFDEEHMQPLEELVNKTRRKWCGYRERSITTLREKERSAIADTFKVYEELLGPIGAAKALHLLAPCFFPLWDRKNAKCYVGALHNRGQNGKKYLEFMDISRRQVGKLYDEGLKDDELLKRIDEYNYCCCTKGWVE